MQNPGSNAGVFVLPAVIPGRAKRGPGIHNHRFQLDITGWRSSRSRFPLPLAKRQT
jgi:hypothetical protein